MSSQKMEVEDDERSALLTSVLADVTELEKRIALADYELLKEQVKRYADLYADRDALVEKIPNFWLRVFEFFFDSSIDSPNIDDLEVARDSEEPKEVEFIFTFSPNDYLADDSLTLKKLFSNLQSSIPDAQITSTKVPIKWKYGKDLTKAVKGAPLSFFKWFAFDGRDEDKGEFPNCVDIALELADEIYPHAHRIFKDCVVEVANEEDVDEDLEESENEDYEDEPAKKRRKSH